MYEELVEQLRHMEKIYSICESENTNEYKLSVQAADAIEKLQTLVRIYNGVVDETVKMLPVWISVDERLPENGEAVNVVWVNHSPVIYYQHIKDKPQTAAGVYYRGKWYWWSAVVQDYLAEYGEWEPDKMDAAIEVTHWMPIPAPPKEETE